MELTRTFTVVPGVPYELRLRLMHTADAQAITTAQYHLTYATTTTSNTASPSELALVFSPSWLNQIHPDVLTSSRFFVTPLHANQVTLTVNSTYACELSVCNVQPLHIIWAQVRRLRRLIREENQLRYQALRQCLDWPKKRRYKHLLKQELQTIIAQAQRCFRPLPGHFPWAKILQNGTDAAITEKGILVPAAHDLHQNPNITDLIKQLPFRSVLLLEHPQYWQAPAVELQTLGLDQRLASMALDLDDPQRQTLYTHTHLALLCERSHLTPAAQCHIIETLSAHGATIFYAGDPSVLGTTADKVMHIENAYDAYLQLRQHFNQAHQ